MYPLILTQYSLPHQNTDTNSQEAFIHHHHFIKAVPDEYKHRLLGKNAIFLPLLRTSFTMINTETLTTVNQVRAVEAALAIIGKHDAAMFKGHTLAVPAPPLPWPTLPRRGCGARPRPVY